VDICSGVCRAFSRLPELAVATRNADASIHCASWATTPTGVGWRAATLRSSWTRRWFRRHRKETRLPAAMSPTTPRATPTAVVGPRLPGEDVSGEWGGWKPVPDDAEAEDRDDLEDRDERPEPVSVVPANVEADEGAGELVPAEAVVEDRDESAEPSVLPANVGAAGGARERVLVDAGKEERDEGGDSEESLSTV
jgi:hypothetical protein